MLIDGVATGIGDAGGSNRSRVNTAGDDSTNADGTESMSFQHLYTTVAVKAHVIKIQGSIYGGTLWVNRTEGDSSDSFQYARSASTLTVMRIGA